MAKTLLQSEQLLKKIFNLSFIINGYTSMEKKISCSNIKYLLSILIPMVERKLLENIDL